MKCKQIAVVLIALSLMAIMFISTVAAIIYFPANMIVVHDKKARTVTLTIDTTSGNGPFDGRTVDINSIVVTVFDKKLNPTIVDPNTYTVALAENEIVITGSGKDFPKKASASNVVGNVGTLGDTFFASGPGWGYRWG